MKKISLLSGLIISLIVIMPIAYNTSNVYCADAKDVSEIQKLLQSGFENARTGKLDAAINDFNKVISLDNKNTSAYVSLGNIYNRKGNLDKAIECFNKAISLNDKNPFAYVGLGNSYAQKGDNDKAIGYFNKAISLDDKNPFAYVGLGNIYSQKGNPDKAIECYNKAISLDDKNPFTYYSLGSLYFSINRKDDALKTLKILKGLNKNLADKLERQMQQPNIPAEPSK